MPDSHSQAAPGEIPFDGIPDDPGHCDPILWRLCFYGQDNKVSSRVASSLLENALELCLLLDPESPEIRLAQRFLVAGTSDR